MGKVSPRPQAVATGDGAEKIGTVRSCGGLETQRARHPRQKRLAVSLAKMLQMLSRQLDEYRAAIETLFQQHPDHDLFGSLPGAGRQTGPTADERVGNGPGTLRHTAIAAMSGGHGPGEFSERADSSGEDAPLLQSASAARGAFVGRLQSGDVRLGTGVLQSPTRAGQKPRLRGALPRPPVVGSALENVADADPATTATCMPATSKNTARGSSKILTPSTIKSVRITFMKKIICKPENISVHARRSLMLAKISATTSPFGFAPTLPFAMQADGNRAGVHVAARR